MVVRALWRWIEDLGRPNIKRFRSSFKLSQWEMRYGANTAVANTACIDAPVAG